MSYHDHTTENWLGLVEFPGYDVSDRGRVRSYWRSAGHAGGKRLGTQPRILKTDTPSQRYATASVRTRDGRMVNRKVGNLVLQAFRGPRPEGMVCRHPDDEKRNNRLENLVWGTPAENTADATRNGYDRRGEGNPKVRFTAADIQEIRRLFAAGWNQGEIGKRYGVHQAHISMICRRAIWRHIP